MDKPREWIIDDAYDLVAGPHPGQERIAVVERSAYDALQAKLAASNEFAQDTLKKLRERIVENDQLKAKLAAAEGEIERLTHNCSVKDKNKARLERMYEAASAERDQLRAEVYSLQSTINHQRAEVERLKMQHAYAMDERDQLRAEVERLKEELLGFSMGAQVEARTADEFIEKYNKERAINAVLVECVKVAPCECQVYEGGKVVCYRCEALAKADGLRK